jgi:hypothetical protein
MSNLPYDTLKWAVQQEMESYAVAIRNDVVNKFKPQEVVTSEDERVAYLYLYMMLICAPICTSSGAILCCYENEMASLNCLPASY